MKTFYITILLNLIWLVPLKSQELGYINDPDGYTNLRNKPSGQSDIIGIITTGQEFYYQPGNSSDWWKVDFKFRSGYVHKSRITNFDEIKSKISKFYQDYYLADKNNTELGEGNNEKLFLLTQDYPLASLTAFCEQKIEIQEFLISEYKSPIHDMIDLQLIYSRLISSNSPCSESKKILSALKTAGQKINLNLTNLKTFDNNISEYNKPENHPTIVNQWFTSELDNKPIAFFLNHSKIDTYAKMFYQGQFAVSDDELTFAFLDSVLTVNPETKAFYLFIFNSVLKVADGALSEYIGSDCRAYLESYPCDFIVIKSNPEYASNYQKWIDFAAFEYYFEQDPIPTINKEFDLIKPKVQANCKDQLNELEKVRAKLIEYIKNN